MMNSRTRNSPARGRGSSRSFVLKWYQRCGSCLYDWISRAWKVIVSSCESARTKERPTLSLSLKTSGIVILPLSSHSSAGVKTGPSISWSPIAFISSRMTCMTFCWTRQPSGRNVKEPGADLPDEASAHEQLVAYRLGVRGRLAQRGKKQL